MKVIRMCRLNGVSVIGSVAVYCVLFFCLSSVAATSHAAIGQTALVSVSPSSATAAGISGGPAISQDGRYLLFRSSAPNLVPDDTNTDPDAFVYDRVNSIKSIIRVPLRCSGGEPTASYVDAISDPAVSAAGRYAAFVVAEQCFDEYTTVKKLYFADIAASTVRLVAAIWDGTLDHPSVTADGRYLAYLVAPWDEPAYVRVLDLVSNTAQDIARQAVDSIELDSKTPSVSPDGRFVVFASDAKNLVSGDTNAASDVFVYTSATSTIERVSVSNSGGQIGGNSYNPVISADGRYVAFVSAGANAVSGDTNARSDVFVRDRVNKTTVRISVSSGGVQSNGASGSPAISGDGRYVAFTSSGSNLVSTDTNTKDDIFVRDRIGGSTARVSVTPAGVQANGSSYDPAISADGRYVSFGSAASNLVSKDSNRLGDVFVYDRTALTLVCASTADVPVAGMPGRFSSVSADGLKVAFDSVATNLVPSDTNAKMDIFVRDRSTNTYERVSVSTSGTQANENSLYPSMSADGRYVAFASGASNLVSGDTNATTDVFVRDRQAKTTVRVSVSNGGAQSNGSSTWPTISADGRFVMFLSGATNLTADPNANYATYLRDLIAGTTIQTGGVFSADGKFLVFESNGLIQVRDLLTGTVTSTGLPDYSYAVRGASAGARRLAMFFSDENGRKIVVADRYSGSMQEVHWNNGQFTSGEYPEIVAISADGKYLLLDVRGIDYFENSVGLFVVNMDSGSIVQVDRSSSGLAGNSPAFYPSMSQDGRFVAFSSDASNITTDPLAGEAIFIHEQSAFSSAPYTASPNSLAFGNVIIGASSASQAVTITNTGTSSLSISSATLGGTNPGQFSRTNGCSNALAPGAQCAVLVYFKPTSTGTKSATLTVTPSGGAAPVAVSLSGTGVTGSVPSFSLSTSSLSFGTIVVGTTSSANTVTITNIGSVLLPITSISLGGTNPSQFSRTHNCPAQLVVGAKCTVSVKFKPTSTGSKSATLKITPGGGAAVKTVALSGTGI